MAKSAQVEEHLSRIVQEFRDNHLAKYVDPLKFQATYQENVDSLSAQLNAAVQARALFSYAETSLEALKETLAENLTEEQKLIVQLKVDVLERACQLRAADYVKELVPFNTNIAQHALFSAKPSNKRKEGELSFMASGVRSVYIKSKTGEILTTYDAKVMGAIQSLWFKQQERGHTTENTVKLKYMDLLRELGLSDGRNNYQRIQRSLIRLKDIEVTLTKYQSHKDAEYEEIALTRLIDEIVFRRKVGSLDHFQREFEIKLPDWLVQANQNGHIFDISLVLMNDLRSYLAQGLYWLMASYTEDDVFEIELETLAAHFHFLNEKTKSVIPAFKIVERISQACEELKEIGVIREYHYRGKKRGLTDRYLVVTKNAQFIKGKHAEQISE